MSSFPTKILYVFLISSNRTYHMLRPSYLT